MRKFIALLLLVVGCTQNPSQDAAWFRDSEKLRVLTTISMIDDLVCEIGGEHVHSIPLIRGELDPHSYELVKGDDEKFAMAEIIFYNGLGLEHGLSLRQNLENNPKAVSVTSSIASDSIVKVDGQSDPHVWMDISLWMQTVEPIVSTLCEKDPVHAEAYRARADALLERMEQADADVYARLQAIDASKRYLVTSHDAFNYFVRRYLAEPDEKEWKLRCVAPEGLAPESQMSVSDVLAVISHVEKFSISVLFPESNVNRDSLKKICIAATEKGFSIRLCPRALYGDAMGKAGSYLDMIGHNVEVIEEELKR